MIHYTAMTSAAAALERLCDPDAEVSAHYLIAGDGTLWQLVAEEMRAWHAGAGNWQGRDDVNSRSIGIELDNTGRHAFSEPQMATLETLLRAVMARWSIPASGVIGHSDMAPARKDDPGARFDWRRLALQGLAIWPDGLGFPCDFDVDAARFGYPQEAQEDVLAAFRARFRPWGHGPLCDADRGIMANLAQRFGVDRAQNTA
ncbi:N-acetylmuramoyl-L-alanine amidase [Sedimentitalea sp. XS_ASV28]|uniref:N-acetylmuramoyl-L-alanine amidase n=1 Tax=Sedimentitalea sp. XS_ASV28 TaxID=3241296 RepID=UPI00351165E3